MKKNENNLDRLLLLEKDYRDKENNLDCFNICLNILDEIKLLSDNQKFDIISKLFLYENQSNYVRIHLMYELFQNNSFINSLSIKRKYYKLLIDSLKIRNATDLLNEKNEIIKLYDKCELNNFEEIDKYIVNIVSNINNINNEINYAIKDKLPSRKSKSFISELIIKPTSMESSEKILDQTINPQSCVQTSFEDINSNRKSYLNVSIRKMMSPSENEINEIKQLMKKYKPNQNLPMVVITVSVNLNRNQFLKLIENIIIKLKYKLICNIKDTEYENINIFEYHPKNCCENLKYIFKRKFIRNQIQILATLKSNENKFNTGINSFLNDTSERKLSIRAIKGNEQNIIQFIINFLQKFSLSMNKIKVIKQSKCLLKYNIEENIVNIINNRKNEIYKK